MSVSGFYRGKAVECQRMASLCDEPERRATYVHMARSWSEIADRAERLLSEIERSIPSKTGDPAIKDPVLFP
jgi:hypothetical protein